MRDLAVIFDMDGVLVNSFQPHYESWKLMAEEHGVTFTREMFQSTFGRTSREILATLWPEPLTPEQVKDLDDRKEEVYRQIIRTAFPEMPGARQLVQRLREAGFRLAIGSSGPRANTEAALEGLGHQDAFSVVISGHDVKQGKPHPEVFLLAAERLGVAPKDCAVIEDAPAGVEAANRAKMTPIAITGTASRERLSGARVVVDSLNELSPERVARLIADGQVRPS